MRKNDHTRNKKGFTLTELIGVITILGLLMILLMPNIMSSGETSRKTLRASKINTLEAAGREYGNDRINTYQKCVGKLDSDQLKETGCILDIGKLIVEGYIEEDQEKKVIDPTTNEPLTGKLLFCYDTANVTVNAFYKEDDWYSCEDISIDSSNTLNLSSSSGKAYVGGNPVKVIIIKSGTFDKGFTCETSDESIATCEVSNDAKTMTITPTGDSIGDSAKDVILTIYGKSSDENLSRKREYKLTVLPTKLEFASLDANDENRCIQLGESEEQKLTTLNVGNITVTENDVLDGIVKNDTLYLSTKNKIGAGTITIFEANGKKRLDVHRKVYNLKMSKIKDSMVQDNTETININYDGTGKITISTDDPRVLNFSTEENVYKEEIVLENGEKSFKILAKDSGTAKVTIKGDDCGFYEKEIYVSNITLSHTEDTLYIGGDPIEVKISGDDISGIVCRSSDLQAASCRIDNDTLHIAPGSKENRDIEITVSNSKGSAVFIAHVLDTSLEVVDGSGAQVKNACYDVDGKTQNVDLFAQGKNFGETNISHISDNLLIDAYVEKSGALRQITINNRKLSAEDAQSPYVEGLNTGRSLVSLTESNGKKVASFYYNQYRLNLAIEEGKVRVDETISFDIEASSTGEVLVESKNPDIATVAISKVNYKDGVNVVNKAKVSVYGNAIGSTEIVIKGATCGEKKFRIDVLPQTYSINLEPGTYTTSIGASTLSCSTTGNSHSCEVVLPEITTSNNYKPIGYHTQKDSKEYIYKAGETITLNSNLNGKTLYGNSFDIMPPVCSITADEGFRNTTVGKTSYINLSCTDSGSSIKNPENIDINSFTVNNPSVGEIVEVTEPTEIENGYSYKIGVTSKEYGFFGITLKPGMIKDEFDNQNGEYSLTNIASLEYDTREWWYIGKENKNDVVAALYKNEDITGEEGTYSLYFYGTGDILGFMESEEATYHPYWFDDYGSLITNVVIKEGITNVSSGLLYSLTNMKSLSLPSSITAIDKFGIANTGLESIAIPESVKILGDSALFNNLSLKEVDLGRVEEIGTSAFEEHRLSSVFIPSTVKSIGDSAFSTIIYTIEKIEFEENSSLKTIGNYAFLNNKVSSLDIPASVEYIGNQAFMMLDTIDKFATLKELSFENESKLKHIGDGAFFGSDLKGDLVLPDSLEEIGYRAFYGKNSGIKKVTLGLNVNDIYGQFITGINLQEIAIDENNEHFSVVDGVLYDKKMEMLVLCPEDYYKLHDKLIVPETVKTLFSYSFNGFGTDFETNPGFELVLHENITSLDLGTNFTNITLGKIKIGEDESGIIRSEEGLDEEENVIIVEVKTIDGSIYTSDGSSLLVIPPAYYKETLEVPEGTTTITEFAGYNNATIKTVTLPSTISKIETSAFLSDSNYSFNTIKIDATGEITIEENAFGIMSNDEEEDLSTRGRTILVRSQELKSLIDSLYQDKSYKIDVEVLEGESP